MVNANYAQDELNKVFISLSKENRLQTKAYICNSAANFELPSLEEKFTTLDPSFLEGEICSATFILQHEGILRLAATIAERCNLALDGSDKSITNTDVVVGMLLSLERYNYESRGNKVRIMKVHGKSKYLTIPVWDWYPVCHSNGDLIGYVIISYSYVFLNYWNPTERGFAIRRTKPSVKYLKEGLLCDNLEFLEFEFDALPFWDVLRRLFEYVNESKVVMISEDPEEAEEKEEKKNSHESGDKDTEEEEDRGDI